MPVYPSSGVRPAGLVSLLSVCVLVSGCEDAAGPTGVDAGADLGVGSDAASSDASVDLGAADAGAFIATPEPGYTLLAPMSSNTTYLVDGDGMVVHTWPGLARPALGVELLPDGSILRPENALSAGQTSRFDAGGAGGRILRIDFDGGVTFRYDLLDDTQRAHHDVEPLPNGHLVAIVWTYVPEAEALGLGFADADVGPDGVWSESLVELAPTGPTTADVVWTWRAIDHLGVGPRRIDPTAVGTAPDVFHVNSVAYDAALDVLLVSAHGLDEVFLLDHATTTAEAAGSTGGTRGHGGDLLHRWGNPANYGAGTTADRVFYGQHDATFVRSAAGVSVLVFDNGARRPDGAYSSVDEFLLPLDAAGDVVFDGVRFGPDDVLTRYRGTPPTSFYAQNLSSAQRLPGGHTLVTNGPGGVVFEVDDLGLEHGRLELPAFGTGPSARYLFRARRFPTDHPAWAGRSLVSQGPLTP